MNKNQLNEDNIISAVARVALKTQESPKTGNLYTTITLHFKNGLEIRYFVDPKDKFGLMDAIKSISQSDKIDNFLNED